MVTFIRYGDSPGGTRFERPRIEGPRVPSNRQLNTISGILNSPDGIIRIYALLFNYYEHPIFISLERQNGFQR